MASDLALTHPALAAEWHPTLNDGRMPADFTHGSKSVVWWRSRRCGHTWDAPVFHRTQLGNGCPYCSGKRVLSGYNDLASQHPHVAARWHTAKNLLGAHEVLAGSSTNPFWWTDCCGHEWEHTVVQQRRYPGCTICKAGRTLDRARPDIAAEWHRSLNGSLTPRDVTPGSNISVWWLCECGHEWRTRVSRRKAPGCPPYQRAFAHPGAVALSTHPIATEWHPTLNGRLTPGHVTIGASRKVWWLGACGHHWEAAIKSRTSGHGCETCQTLHAERGLLSALTAVWPDAAGGSRVHVPWGSERRRQAAVCDVLVPSLRLVVEYDGYRWHLETAARDTAKTRALLDAGYTVVRIREQVGTRRLPHLPLAHPRLLQITHRHRPLGKGATALAARIRAALDEVEGSA